MTRWLVLPILLMLASCDSAPLTVSLASFDDGLANFDVANRADSDVRAATFLVRYGEAQADAPSVDTVSYATTEKASGQPIPFVRAGESTLFSHSLPAEAVTSGAEVVSVEFWDGSVWPENQ